MGNKFIQDPWARITTRNGKAVLDRAIELAKK